MNKGDGDLHLTLSMKQDASGEELSDVETASGSENQFGGARDAS